MLNIAPLSVLIHDQAKKYGDRTALAYRDYMKNRWVPISWNEFSHKVSLVSDALLSLGVEVQENIGVFSPNKPECFYVDFGAYGIRAVTIPFYDTSSEAQVKYMIEDAGIHYLFVGEQYQYDTALRVNNLCHTLKRIIVFDPEVRLNPEDNHSIYFHEFLEKASSLPHKSEVEKRAHESLLVDLANILYTSGTTGNSKGVKLTHGNYHFAMLANDKVLPMSENDIILNFLPFTHVFERAWSYLCIAEGCTLFVNQNPKDVLTALSEVRPTCMCSVPRFWEKVYAGVQDKMQKSAPAQRRLMERAIKVGKSYFVDHVWQGKSPSVALKMKYKFYEFAVFKPFRKLLGLDRANFFPTAGAAISKEVETFIHSAGLNMITGYGLTESTATVSCDHILNHEKITMGSVGRLIDGLEIKFGENHEILLRGKTITPGYFKKDEITKETIDPEGWFHTGDAGYMKDGELYLTDRIKDLFKTSNGKYIAPQMIESKLLVDRFIDQITVIADEHKFVSALIVPDFELLKRYAVEHGIQFKNTYDLVKNPEIVEMMTERVETLQQEFAHYEKIKKFVLLPEPFTIEKGELTNTLKIKRPIVYKNYADEIRKMYAE